VIVNEKKKSLVSLLTPLPKRETRGKTRITIAICPFLLPKKQTNKQKALGKTKQTKNEN